MKTLYININNEDIQSTEEQKVLDYGLDIHILFYLGEKIAKGCKVEDEISLITEFNSPENEEEYKRIAEQIEELKIILFSDECKGSFEFKLPKKYINWLNYHPNFNPIYNKNFSNDRNSAILINLEELYEDSVVGLQEKILDELRYKELYKRIVFNTHAVTHSSSIVDIIKESYKDIEFIPYQKYQRLNEQKDTLEFHIDSSTLIIKKGVRMITPDAFHCNTNFEKTIIPASVTHIGDGAFWGCINLKQINIPNSVTHIGDRAFLGCTNLKQINIPNSVTHIGDRAFQLCTNLKQINIPNSVTHIGDRAFWSCTNLKQINIPNSVTHIGDGAFSFCYNLQQIECDSNIYPFENDSLYTKNYKKLMVCISKEFVFSIPDHVEIIGEYAFATSEISYLTIPQSVKVIIGNPFYNGRLRKIFCDSNYFVCKDDTLYSKDLTELIVSWAVVSLEIPESVTKIHDFALFDCNFEELVLPNSVVEIGNCGLPCSLERLYISSGFSSEQYYKLKEMADSNHFTLIEEY